METVTNNLVDVYTELRASGYDQEIHLHKTHLHAIEKDIRIEANDFEIEAAFRFEGSVSEEDTSEVYAISSVKHGIKGILD